MLLFFFSCLLSHLKLHLPLLFPPNLESEKPSTLSQHPCNIGSHMTEAENYWGSSGKAFEWNSHTKESIWYCNTFLPCCLPLLLRIRIFCLDLWCLLCDHEGRLTLVLLRGCMNVCKHPSVAFSLCEKKRNHYLFNSLCVFSYLQANAFLMDTCGFL